jgi:oligoendopeptidase F
MSATYLSDLWPGRTAEAPAQDELRRRAAALAQDQAAVEEWCAGDPFSGTPAEIAAMFARIADLRAMVLHWDGYYATELAAGRSDEALRDVRLLAAAAVDTVDELMQSAEQAWLALPDDRARELLDQPAIEPYRHYLAGVRALAPYTLSEQAEMALAARSTSADTAWVELYYQLTTRLQPVVAGVPHSLERARSLLELHDAEQREQSLAAIYDALEPMAPVLSKCLDSLVVDRLALDEVRGLPHPRAERDLTNELPSTVVDDMLAVVEEHYALPQRWFARKARLLGADRLDFSHMRAPIGSGETFAWPEAVHAVTEAFDGLAPDAGRMVRELINGGHVDHEPRQGKQQGAFCRSLGPGRPPRIQLSYFDTVEDLISLGHEAGHALQFTLAGHRQGGLTFDAPLVLNEVAPAFTELLVMDWLIDNSPDPASRRLLAAKRIDSAIDAIFMSTFLTRFETRAHQIRADGETLTDDRIRQLWTECGREFYGPLVVLPPRWGLHWALVPHVIHERFYSYTYAFAQLVGLTVYASYRRDPDGFRPRFLDMLGRGSSIGPAEQLALLGIDLADRETWRVGMGQFAELLDPLLGNE